MKDLGAIERSEIAEGLGEGREVKRGGEGEEWVERLKG